MLGHELAELRLMAGSLRSPDGRCAVLGSPIAHSLSPALHRAAYAALGLDWSYQAIEVGEDGLSGFLAGLDESWRGLSLTMPLKRTVMPLLDDLDDWARLSGAANTVVLDAGRRSGANTDIPGAVAAVRERTDRELPGWEVGEVIVLGGGATAASTLIAAAAMGATSGRVLVRDPARAGETLAAVARATAELGEPMRLGVGTLADPIGEPDLLVSTVPVSAQGEALVAGSAGASVVFEVVYDPWPTPLARAAAERGQVLVSGLDLLVHQAVLQVELMTGLPGPLAAMRGAGERALAERAR